jgi:predicted transposase YbfD/YdcC
MPLLGSWCELRAWSARGTRPRLTIPVPIAVAGVDPLGAALAMRRTASPFDLELRQPVGGKDDHVAQKSRIGTLRQQLANGDPVVGHHRDLQGQVACGSSTLPKITAMAGVRPASAKLWAVATATGAPDQSARVGSGLRDHGPIHALQRGLHKPRLSVWDAETRVSIAAGRAPGGNEVAGTLAVLKALTLKGTIVTADALHHHPAMAKAVRSAGADDALGLKAKHGPLYQAGIAAFAEADGKAFQPFFETTERGHDREESRCASVLPRPGDGRWRL